MKLDGIAALDPAAVREEHGFVFDAHDRNRSRLIVRYRGTVVERTEEGVSVTGWQKSVYHFGGLNREVPIVLSLRLDEEGLIRSLKIDERSRGSQGRRCDFACLEALCGKKLAGTALEALPEHVSSASELKCLHLYEILSACASFYAYLLSQGLRDGTEQEYLAIRPDDSGLCSDSVHEILGWRDRTEVRLEHRTPPRLGSEKLAESLDALVTVRYNGRAAFSEELRAGDFEGVYAQLNRVFSKCHHLEKEFFALKGRVRFFNSPSMAGLFLLTISHSAVRGLVSRAWKIEKILHWLQTGYGKNPCKGFGG